MPLKFLSSDKTISRRRKQDIVASLKAIAAVIATLLAFLLFLMLFVVAERAVLG
jgi:hypothetical protein